jgi:hypothetical protein
MIRSYVNSFINTYPFKVLRVDFFTEELLCNFSKDRLVIKEDYSQDSCVRLLMMSFSLCQMLSYAL